MVVGLDVVWFVITFMSPLVSAAWILAANIGMMFKKRKLVTLSRLTKYTAPIVDVIGLAGFVTHLGLLNWETPVYVIEISFYLWMWRWTCKKLDRYNDDDAWKRTKKAAKEIVKQIGQKLVVAAAEPAAT